MVRGLHIMFGSVWIVERKYSMEFLIFLLKFFSALVGGFMVLGSIVAKTSNNARIIVGLTGGLLLIDSMAMSCFM